MRLANSLAAIVFIVMTTVTGCSKEESAQTPAKPASDATASVQQGTVQLAAPEPCEARQSVFTTGYQNFPGLQCSEIPAQIDSTYTTRIGFRKECQKLTGASSRPESIARVQVNECGPLRQEAGSYASMQVCCGAPAPVAPEKMIAYDVKLDCPAGHVQALATDLHYPGEDCAQAVANAESRLDISAYQNACDSATRNSQGRQSILDAGVFTCREGVGAMVDVAVCCSAKLPPGRKMYDLLAPADIWETLRLGDLFGLQLLLSRYPERTHEQGLQNVTPLHLAGSLAIADLLLKRRADLEARDADGSTPLHYSNSRRALNPSNDANIAVGFS